MWEADDITAKMLTCNCLAVRQAARYVTQIYDRHLASSGLTITQFGILVRLKRRPLTINELAAEMIMDRTTLGRTVKPLERDGLISVTPRESDRRAKELRLTKKGEKRLDVGRVGWAEAQTHFEADFGADRSAEMRALLHALIAGGGHSLEQAIQQ